MPVPWCCSPSGISGCRDLCLKPLFQFGAAHVWVFCAICPCGLQRGTSLFSFSFTLAGCFQSLGQQRSPLPALFPPPCSQDAKHQVPTLSEGAAPSRASPTCGPRTVLSCCARTLTGDLCWVHALHSPPSHRARPAPCSGTAGYGAGTSIPWALPRVSMKP